MSHGLLDALLDLVAGSACVACGRPGRRLCRRCESGLRAVPRSRRPTPSPPGLLPVTSAGTYDGALRALLLAHKERSALGLVVPLGRLLADTVAQLLPEDPQGTVALVPVPSHPSVVRGRGHDPVLRLVRRAARVLRRRGVLVEVRRLLVVGDRPLDQAGLSAEERRANLQGRFRAVATWAGIPDRVEPPTQVLLVDDVLTTGSTLREAQRALESAGLRPAGAVTLAATLRRVGRS